MSKIEFNSSKKPNFEPLTPTQKALNKSYYTRLISAVPVPEGTPNLAGFFTCSDDSRLITITNNPLRTPTDRERLTMSIPGTYHSRFATITIDHKGTKETESAEFDTYYFFNSGQAAKGTLRVKQPEFIPLDPKDSDYDNLNNIF